jgi:hypothetical protein
MVKGEVFAGMAETGDVGIVGGTEIAGRGGGFTGTGEKEGG